jgi:hypothetical protein
MVSEVKSTIPFRPDDRPHKWESRPDRIAKVCAYCGGYWLRGEMPASCKDYPVGRARP